MNVIIDTSVWSEFFRRNTPDNYTNVQILKNLIREGRATMLGVVKQELLSGMSHPERFQKLSQVISGFPPLLATEEDHILGAKFYNRCRSKGIQGSYTDYLICAQAYNNKFSILSSDKDFLHYKEIIPIHVWAK